MGQTGAAGTRNRGLLPWAIVDTTETGGGSSFAGYVATIGIQGLSAADYDLDALTATNDNMYVSAGYTAAGATSINSLTLTGAGDLAVGANTVTIASGGILAQSGNTGNITGSGSLTAGATDLIVHVVGSANALSIAPVITGTGGLTKAGAGVLTFSAINTYTGTTSINGGKLVLAGGNNTIAMPLAVSPGLQPGVVGAIGQLSQQFLWVNNGATLDLNGNSQWVANMASNGALPGTGGTITNSAGGSPVNFRVGITGQNTTFAGRITGNLNFIRSGAWGYVLNSDNSYTGSTLVEGGQTVLQDAGRLSATSGITVRRGALWWNDQGLQAMSNRLASAPITLTGGAFSYSGRGTTAGVANLGALTLNSGANLIQVQGNNGTATLNIASLSRVNTGAAVTFYSGQPTLNGAGATSGALGEAQRVKFGTAPTLANGLIGAWATAIGIDYPANNTVDASFATYDPESGVRALGVLDYNNTFALNNNVRLAAATTIPTGGTTINSLTLNGAAFAVGFAAATDTLTLQSGGLLSGTNNNARSLGTVAIPGQITASAGVNELFIHNGGNTFTVNSRVIDNGVTSGLNVIFDALSQQANTPTIVLTAPNTYAGTTYVNGVTLGLNTAGGTAVPGNVILSGNSYNCGDSLPPANASVALLQSNQIPTTANVTLNGGTLLNLNNFSNTIASLIFNSDGGTRDYAGPTVTTGLGTLTVNNTISSNNPTNAWVVPTMQGNLSLGGATRNVNVDPVLGVPLQVGLAINAVISNGGINKTGTGVLALGGASTYTGPTNITAGGLALNAAGAFIGGSQVTLAANTFVDLRGYSGTFGSLASAATTSSLTNTGAAATLTLGLDNTSTTFAGPITSTTPANLSLTKIGTGDFNIAGLGNTATGTLTVNGGSVTLSGPAGNSIAFATDVVNAGGVLKLDNSANTVDNRLSGAALNLGGGTLDYTVYNTAGTNSNETAGVLTLSTGRSVININNAGANTGTLTFASATFSAGSTVDFTGVLGASNKVLFTTAPALVPATTGILARATVNGADFATYDAANGIVAFSAYNTAADINSAAAIDTMKVSATTTNTLLSASKTLNAVAINGTGLTVSALPNSTLTLTSGGMLVTGTGNRLSVPFVALGGVDGVIGNTGNTLITPNPLIYLNQVNGTAPAAGAFLGPWMIFNSGDYGAYHATSGITLYGNYPTYAGTLASGNVTNLTATTALSAANNVTGALRLSAGATLDLTFSAATNVLNLETGGLLRSNNNNGSTIGTAALPGVLTAGGTAASGNTELIIFGNQNTITVNSLIKDLKDVLGSGTATVSLVKGGANTLALAGANTFTGGTTVNQGTLNLTGAAGTVVIPASANGLTINNATVTMVTNSGQIAGTNDVFLNGGSTLTLVGTNTLNSVTFGDGGGTTTPTLAVGTLLTIGSANALTATNSNYATTPVISGTGLALASTAPVINTSGLSPIDLIISAPILTAAGTVSKNGSGSVVLSGASTFTTGVNLNQGTIILGAASTPSTVGATVTSGPLGTGTLTLADGTTLQADTTARANANAMTVNGNVTLGAIGTNTLTLNGAVALGASPRTLTVNSAVAVGGAISGSGLTKAGPGTLTLSNTASNWSGATTVNGGVLALGASGAIPDTSDLTVASGAAFNLNAFGEAVNSIAGAGLITNSGAAATLTLAGNNLTPTTFSGVINAATAANLSLVKNGNSTLTLTGTSTYAGTTAVNAGTLALGSGGNLGATALTLTSGGTFASVPAVTGATNNLGGSLTVGSNAAFTMADGATSTLNVGGAFTTGGALPASLVFDINGSTFSTSDKLAVTGAATTSAGGTRITINNIAGTLAPGNQYTLITAASGLSGAGLSLATSKITIGGNTYSLSLASSTATSEILTIGTAGLDAVYWTGSRGNAWNAVGGSPSITNWATDITGGTDAGAQPTAPTDVFFTATGAGNLSNTLGANYTVNSLNFASSAGAVTVGGSNTLTLAGASGINVAAGSGAQTVNAPVTLGANQTWTNNSANPLTLGGAITNGGYALSLAGTGPVVVTGAISGTGGVLLSGTGAATLAGIDTYTGSTTVASGATLNINGSISGTAVTVNSGGLLNVNKTNGLTGTTALTVPAGATAVLNTGNNNTGATNVAGTIQLGHNASLAASALTLTTGATIQLRNDFPTTFTTASTTGSGAATLNFDVNSTTAGVPGRTLTFSPITLADKTNNTINVTGGNGYALGLGAVTSVSSAAGTYTTTFNATSADLTVASLTAGAYGTNIAFTGTRNITVSGAIGRTSNGWANLTINGPNVTLAGATTNSGSAASGGYTALTAGTLNINNATALQSNASIVAFRVAGGTIDNTTAAALTETNNPSQQWNGDFTFTGTSSLNLGTGAVAMNATRNLTVSNNTLTVGGIISGATFGLTKSGNGTLVLTGVNTYTGATNVAAGSLTVSGAGTIATSSALSVGSNAQFSYLPATVGALAFPAGSTLTLANNANIGLALGDTITVAGAGTTGANTNLALSGAFTSGTEYTLLNAASGLPTTASRPTPSLSPLPRPPV